MTTTSWCDSGCSNSNDDSNKWGMMTTTMETTPPLWLLDVDSNNDDDYDENCNGNITTMNTTINKVRDNLRLANGSYIPILSIMHDMNLDLRCIL